MIIMGIPKDNDEYHLTSLSQCFLKADWRNFDLACCHLLDLYFRLERNKMVHKHSVLIIIVHFLEEIAEIFIISAHMMRMYANTEKLLFP